jgi:stage II sporulation protein D
MINPTQRTFNFIFKSTKISQNKKVFRDKELRLTKKQQKRFYFLLLLSLFFSQISSSPKSKPNFDNIRVLLPTPKPTNKKYKAYRFNITSSNGIKIRTQIKTKRKIIYKKENLTIEVNKLGIYLVDTKNKKIKVKSKAISLVPLKDDHLRINNTPYQGIVTIHLVKNGAPQIVNTLKLDDYIYSVLRYELYQSWALEVQKVQAITSRTYAVYQIKNARRQNKVYDIKNNNFHQTYKGTHNYSHLRKAVSSTKNSILTYKNKIALTMFDACCGGVIPANMSEPRFEKCPYLARKSRCTYCKKNSFFRWGKNIKIDGLLSSLKTKQNIGKFRNIKVLKKDKAGITHKVLILGSKKSIQCSGKDLWDCMRSNVRSQNFSLKKVPHKNEFKISGKGFGHHLGLCQFGARELVRKGWKYKKILKFYYPGTKLNNLKKI